MKLYKNMEKIVDIVIEVLFYHIHMKVIAFHMALM